MLDRKKVLVIGDLILDEYLYTEAVGLSLESPTLKAEYISEKKQLGGAGNLVMNLKALDREVYFFTAFNDSSIGDLLDKNNVKYFNLNKQHNVKSRFYVNRKGNSYKHLQVNYGSILTLNKEDEDIVLSKLIKVIEEYDSVILSDYRAGFLSQDLTISIIKLCRSKKKPCIVNTQLSDWGIKKELELKKFENCSLFILNEDEEKFYNLRSESITTLGSKGCRYNGIVYPPRRSKVVDTCGAGDSFTAMASLVSLDNSLKALDYCNIWAGLATETKGATPPSYELFKSIISERYRTEPSNS
jgi:bifunctional ADP-heptose synthase (sugar kinase/adenylyltransferase)